MNGTKQDYTSPNLEAGTLATGGPSYEDGLARAERRQGMLPTLDTRVS